MDDRATDPAPNQRPRGRTVADLSDLTGRTIVVTGGAGHIARSAAAGLVEQGATVAIVDLDPTTCEQTAHELGRDRDDAAFAVPCDLSDEMATRSVAARVLERTGSIDGLIHFAALVSSEPIPNWTTPFEQQGTDAWRRALDVNLTAVFVLTQACAPALRSSGRGTVVTVGSTYGMVGPDWRIYDGTDMGNAAGYAASKGGVIQLTRWMATTLAPEIRVNCLSPGGVLRDHPDSFRSAYEERTPMRRMATEEDYIGACLFLVSDLSAYVTGQNLAVDGGWTAW